MTRYEGTLKPSTCQRRAPRLELRTESVKFGSDTVHHQLENNPRAIPATQTRENDFLQTTSNITKVATRTAEQVVDANSSHNFVKRHLQ